MLFLAASWRALVTPFWFDELLSYYVATLPDFETVLRALQSSADGQPPLFHFCLRISQAIFGATEFGTRLPTVTAYALASLAFYRFVTRRLGPPYALLALLVVWLSYSQRYAVEGRPYAFMLGFCALALLAWSRAGEPQRRRTWLMVFAGALVGLLSSHYYAGLLLIPFGVGEAVRTWTRRRADGWIWIILAASPLVLVAHLPLLRSVTGDYVGHFWRSTSSQDFYLFYWEALSPALVPLLLGAIFGSAAAAWIFSGPARQAPSRDNHPFPLHEVAALATLALIPLVYVAVALLWTNVFAPRYAVGSILGIAGLAAAGLHRVAGGRLTIVRATWIPLALCFGALSLWPLFGRDVDTGENLHVFDETFAQILQAIPADGAPIVVEHPLLFLPYYHYAPPELRARLAYATDAAAAREIVGTDNPDVSLARLARWAAVPALPLESFRARNPRFYVVSYQEDEFNWLLQKQSESNGGVCKLLQRGSMSVWEVGRNWAQKSRPGRHSEALLEMSSN